MFKNKFNFVIDKKIIREVNLQEFLGQNLRNHTISLWAKHFIQSTGKTRYVGLRIAVNAELTFPIPGAVMSVYILVNLSLLVYKDQNPDQNLSL